MIDFFERQMLVSARSLVFIPEMCELMNNTADYILETEKLWEDHFPFPHELHDYAVRIHELLGRLKDDEFSEKSELSNEKGDGALYTTLPDKEFISRLVEVVVNMSETLRGTRRELKDLKIHYDIINNDITRSLEKADDIYTQVLISAQNKKAIESGQESE